LLERFFAEIYNNYKTDAESKVSMAILSSATFADKLKLEAQDQRNPSMKIMDKALAEDTSIQQAVWEQFKIDLSVSYPLLPPDLTHGFLSGEIHQIDNGIVYISSEAPDDYKKFFRVLAMRQKTAIEEFSAEGAYAGSKMR
jgi:hypothetical protein